VIADLFAPTVGAAVRDPELVAREAHFTPLPVVAQMTGSLASVITPCVVAGLGAGAGGIEQAVGVTWPHARRVAVEVRPSERPHLERNCHAVIIDDLRSAAVARVLGRLAPDLFIFNPPFSLTLECLALALRCVRPGGLVACLTRQTLGDHEVVEEFLRTFPPTAELTIGGRVSMTHAGRKCDQFGYQWLVWTSTRRPDGVAWPRRYLPRLATSQLGWLERPGTGSDAPARRLDPDLIIDLRPMLGPEVSRG
jgi:hypothetical protein